MINATNIKHFVSNSEMFSDFTNTSATMGTDVSPLIVNPLYVLFDITFLAKTSSTLRTQMFANISVNLTHVSAEILDRDSTFWALFSFV